MATVVCPAGAFEGDLETKPRLHIFVASKSPMLEITDSLRQFAEYPPGYGTTVPAPAHTSGQTTDVAVQGSCLCGAVAFAIDEAPQKLVNCHCSRCRRSRGAAHGTSFFVRTDKLHWTRGADRVRSFKLPGADVFATGFCGDCGSLLPVTFDAIRRYQVPAGSIDTPLAIQPLINIHVGSKASWFDITDSLPQFEVMPPAERLRELMF